MDNNEKELEIVDESGKRSGTIDNIVKSSAHVYCHLMKYVYVYPILKGWVRTIYEQCNQLSEITNKSFWRDVLNNPRKLEEIKTRAITEFAKDNENINAEIVFAGIQHDFPDIQVFQSWPIVQKYMVNYAEMIYNYDMSNFVKNYKADK